MKKILFLLLFLFLISQIYSLDLFQIKLEKININYYVVNENPPLIMFLVKIMNKLTPIDESDLPNIIIKTYITKETISINFPLFLLLLK